MKSGIAAFLGDTQIWLLEKLRVSQKPELSLQKKVLAPKGWKNVYEQKKASEKEAITVLLVFSAAGITVHPMVVFPYIRPPASVVKSMPDSWFLGRSDSGWMKSEAFYEYIANGVNTWLVDNKVPKPVICSLMDINPIYLFNWANGVMTMG